MSNATKKFVAVPGKRSVGAAEVRAFAQANDLPFPAGKGRPNLETIEAYNDAHAKGKGRSTYVTGHKDTSRTVTGKNARGQAKTRKVAATSVIRAWGRDNGYTVGDRGRIDASVKLAWLLAQK